MSLLAPEVVKERLRALPEWTLEGQGMARRYKFPDFAAAMVFVNKVAAEAEKVDHHPDIDIRYNQVKLGLISHDQGGLTERDIKMAHTLNSVSL